MTTLEKSVFKIGLASALWVMAFGCSENGQASADARSKAEEARANVVDANARVTAADAHVKAAEADDRVAALSDRRTGNTASAKAVIPSGAILKVMLIDAIDSETNGTGDRFLASLAEAVVINGATLLPKGTKVRGRVIAAEGSGRVKGRASVRLELTDITQSNNRLVAITTEPLEATAASTETRDTKVIAGGAGVGAIIGAIAGGKKGAAIGVATGGGAGTGVVLATRGKEVHYDPETRLDFTLAHSVDL